MTPENFSYIDLVDFAAKYAPYNELPRSHGIILGESSIFKNQQFLTLIESTPVVMHVFDFYEMKPIYYSKNVESLTGYSVEQYKEGGLAFMMSLFHPDHVRIVQEQVMPKLIEVITTHVALNKVKDLKFAYNFKARRKDGEYIWILHQMTVLDTDDTGFPVLGVYLSTDITNVKKDETVDLIVSLKQPDGIMKNIEIISYRSPTELMLLSSRELEVLNLMRQGKSSKMIADTLCISPHTVNNHRKKMLEKTRSSNTAELLDFAQKKGYFH